MDAEKVGGQSSGPPVIYVSASERVNVLLLIAIWLWPTILKFLSSYQLDVSTVIQTRSPGGVVVPLSQLHVQRLSRRFATRISRIIIPLQVVSIICQQLSESNGVAHLLNSILPMLQFTIIVGSIMNECQIIRYCTKRILLIEPSPRSIRNVYILLSDTLTSFTKPLIDFSLYLTALVLSQDEVWTHFDLLISLFPLIIRIWQCLREFYLARDKSMLMNAMKYCSGIPIVVCVWYTRVEPENYHVNTVHWFQCLNSCFTLFWDVKVDWKCNSFFHIRKDLKSSNSVMFPKIVYYIGFLIDFTIKFWWIWVLHRPNHMLFFQSELQYLEVFRRSIWVVFKLESEYVMTRNLVTEK